MLVTHVFVLFLGSDGRVLLREECRPGGGCGAQGGGGASAYEGGSQRPAEADTSENASGVTIQILDDKDIHKEQLSGQNGPQNPKDASEETFVLPKGVERYFEEKRAQRSRLRAEDANTVVKLGELMTDSDEEWDRRCAETETEEIPEEEDNLSKMAVSEFGGANGDHEGAVSIEIEQLEDGEMLKREILTKSWVDKSVE